MAVVSKEELLSKLKVKFGDAADDETLSIIEDVSDTFDDYETKTKDNSDWKTKYTELDETWRKKYRDRFYSPVDGDGHDMDKVEQLSKQTGESETVMTSYEDLFEEDK